MKCLRLEIYGRVQGVFFRANVKKIADDKGVVGWIKNNTDGSVSVLAQGEEEKLNEFILKIKNSPGASKVENIKTKWSESNEEFKDFRVSREDRFLRDKGKSVRNFIKKFAYG